MTSTVLMADIADKWVGNYTGLLEVAMISATGEQAGAFDPVQTTIPVTKNANGTLNFTLENLALTSDGETMYIGNVSLTNIAAGEPLKASQQVVLQNGTSPADADWMAEMVNTLCGGSVPVQLEGSLGAQIAGLVINIDISSAVGYNVQCSFRALRYATQLPNADFEETWTTNKKSNKYTEQTPASWHSFYDATGSASGAAFMLANQLGTLSQVTGYDGTGYAAQIKAQKNFLNTISNGNMTNGIVNMGATGATSTSNYNYSDISSESKSLKFSGLPDSIAAYFVFKPANSGNGNASMTASLHGAYNFTDPMSSMPTDTASKYNVAYASASIAPTEGWQRVSVPFAYNGDNYLTSAQNYLLVSFSTNEGKGKGATGDVLSIDHIRLIYNSRLASLQVGGKEVEGFSPDKTEYTVSGSYNDNVTAVADGKGAQIAQKLSEDGTTLTLTVQGADYLNDNTNFHTYTLHFTTPVAIKQATAQKADGTVNVYTTDGVLLRKGVKAGEATQGLGRGLYIVGKKVIAIP